MDDNYLTPPEWLAWLLDRAGQPRPCALCRTPTPPERLRETTVPGAVVTDPTVGLDFTVQTVVWVCPACPG